MAVIYYVHVPIMRKCIQLERWTRSQGIGVTREDGGVDLWLGRFQVRIDEGDYYVPARVPERP